jgi:hypothetical protein
MQHNAMGGLITLPFVIVILSVTIWTNISLHQAPFGRFAVLLLVFGRMFRNVVKNDDVIIVLPVPSSSNLFVVIAGSESTPLSAQLSSATNGIPCQGSRKAFMSLCSACRSRIGPVSDHQTTIGA